MARNFTVSVLLILFILDNAADAATYYVAPSGNDSLNGAIGSPWKTLSRAHGAANPGDTIFLRGGTHTYPSQTNITRDGASGNRIQVFNFSGELPVIDAINQGSGNYVIFMQGADWWHFKGIEIKNGAEGGFRVDNSSNNIVEFMHVHHNGRASTSSGKGIVFYNGGGNNVLLNNDSHHNRDLNLGNADGINLAMTGTGNVLRGNRSWRNSDDGFDNFCITNGAICRPILIENNWAFDNGKDDAGNGLGNGMGFKLGGVRPNTGGSSGGHTVRNNLAWSNRNGGFDDACSICTGARGNELQPLTMHNNTAWNNKDNYIFHAVPSVFRNNINFGNLGAAFGSANFNSWTLPVAVNSADFQSLVTTCATGPRQANGDLPFCPFLRLAAGSDLIDKGTNVGIAFNGTAPDLGAFESGGAPPPPPPPPPPPGPPPPGPPIVSITAPANGATVSGSSVTVSANASDPGGAVLGVQFLLDGENLGAEDTATPYSVTWNTTTASEGTHILTAVARDAVPNTTISSPITVTVDNIVTPLGQPISHYRFDEIGGQIAFDSITSNNNHLALVSSGAFFVSGGQLGNALSLNGVSGFASDDVTTSLNLSATVTIAAWVKPSALPAGAFSTLVVKGNYETDRGWGVSFFDGKLYFAKIGVLTVASNVIVPVGTFHHVAVTWNGSTGDVKFYLDGVLGQTVNAPGAIVPPINEDDLNVGKFPISGFESYYSGMIDDLQIYDTVLTGADILTLATATPSNTPPTVSLTAPAVGDTVSGPVTVSATASDSGGSVAGVQFKLDGGNLLAEDTLSPYSIVWNSALAIDGVHQLSAVARDNLGATTTAAPRSVTVNNASICP